MKLYFTGFASGLENSGKLMSGKSQGNIFLEKVREKIVELPIFHIFSLRIAPI